MKKRIKRWNKITAMLLILTLLLVSLPIAGVSEEEFGTVTSSNGNEEENSSTPLTEAQPQPTFSVASEADEITPNPDYDPNGGGTRSTSVPTVPSSAPLANGVYQLINEDSGKALDMTSGGTTSGTVIQQWTAYPIANNRNQLFKITYLHHQNGHYYYSIRPMTNSGLGLHGSTPEEGGIVTAVQMPPEEDFLNIELSMRWEIIKDGDYYLFKNGSLYDGGYLHNNSSLENGASMIVCQPEEIDGSAMWAVEAYTGEVLEGIYRQNFVDVLLEGEQYKFTTCMYSSIPGCNGPVSYRVRNEDYSTTDKATILSVTGILTALKPGVIKIGVTYPNAPWIWWRNVRIEFTDNMIYMFKLPSSNVLLNPSTGNINSHMLAQTYDGNKTSMMWRIEHVSNGFYSIRNEATGYYLRAPESNENNELIIQSAYSGTYGLWKFVRTSDNHFRIQSKNQYERETDEPLYLSVLSGIVIQSNTVSNNKWDFKALTLNLNIYYDQAFCDIYDDIGVDTEDAILNILERNTTGASDYRSVSDFFAEEFGIRVNIQIMDGVYVSYPYAINCLYKHYPTTRCENCTGTDSIDPDSYLQCKAGLHHKSANKIVTCTPQSDVEINLLFTGHTATCGYDGSTHKDTTGLLGRAENVGSGNRGAVFLTVFSSITNYNAIKLTTTHEILHLLNLHHHYESGVLYCIAGKERHAENVERSIDICFDCIETINQQKFRILYSHSS